MDIRFTDDELRRWRASFRRSWLPRLPIPGPPHLLKREVAALTCFVVGLLGVALLRYVFPLLGWVHWTDG